MDLRSLGAVLFVLAFSFALFRPAPTTPGMQELRPMRAAVAEALADARLSSDPSERGILSLVQVVVDAASELPAALGDSLAVPTPIYTVNDEIVPGPPAKEPGRPQAFPTDAGNPDDMSLRHPQSLTPQEIDGVLAEYESPAMGKGQAFYELGREFNIDAAYALAFFIHESTAGTACPGWVGCTPDGKTTHNIGNIICAGYATCHADSTGRMWRSYASWEEGLTDWYRLIDVEYIGGRGHQTVDDVIPVYAPAFENNVDGYRSTVAKLVAGWRKVKVTGPPELVSVAQDAAQDAAQVAPLAPVLEGYGWSEEGPKGCPIVPTGGTVVTTQAYGPTHSGLSREKFGAVDLAVDGGEDGIADPYNTWDQPVVALFEGVVIATPNSGMAGNHVWLQSDDGKWRIGYAHLNSIRVTNGQRVASGEEVGRVGSSGGSSGPHLDLQFWFNGQNINPELYITCGR